jgi:hypothetical protein
MSAALSSMWLSRARPGDWPSSYETLLSNCFLQPLAIHVQPFGPYSRRIVVFLVASFSYRLAGPMNDRELNRHLTELSEAASDAHEMLRGIRDAIAVLRRSTQQAAVDDIEDLSEAERAEWRRQAEEVTDESSSLLQEAASLLKQTAADIESVSAPKEVTAPDDEDGPASA